MLTNQATGPDVFPEAVLRTFSGLRVCAPVSTAPAGEMAARLAAKHQNKRPCLPTGPFVYVAMTAAFPGGGAAHLFRATVFVAPVSAAPPGKMAARLTAKHKNKRPGLPAEPFVYVAITAAFPGGGAAHLFRATGLCPGKHSASGGDGGASGRKTPKQKALSSDRAFRLRCYDSGFPRRRCCAPFPGYGFCSPGKRSATGEDGGTSDRKTQKQKARSSG